MRNKRMISYLLAFALLVTAFGDVSAKSFPQDKSNPVPTITPISGDQDFTHETVAILDLPGTTPLDDEMPVPVGFSKGEKQFEGVGLKVSGFDYGKARVCFPLSSYNQGWGGKVAKWTGSKWELLNTTISTPADSSDSLACSDISSSGTYALLAWVVDSSKLPTAAKPTCDFTVNWVEIVDATPPVDHGAYFTTNISKMKIYSTADLSGKSLTLSVYQSVPSGQYTWDGSASGTLSYFFTNEYILGPFTPVSATLFTTLTSEEYLLDFGSCTTTAPNGSYME